MTAFNQENFKEQVDRAYNFSHGDISRTEIARSILINEFGPERARTNRKLRKALAEIALAESPQ